MIDKEIKKVIKDVAKHQKKEMEDRKEKDISITSLEDALGIALMKLAMRDEEKVDLQDLMRPLDALDKEKK
tara:strand:+ start:617 stop:829 length:213 start_codon:yes stop_codon:yes gene_type:complete